MQAFEQSFAINSMEYYGAPAETDSNYFLETFHQYPHGDFRPTFYNPFEIKHRRRTSRAQLKVLEKSFSENPKPNATVRRILAQKLDMTPRGVQIWFQNRRAKAKLQRRKASAAAAAAEQQQQQQQPQSSDIHVASSSASTSASSASSSSSSNSTSSSPASIDTNNNNNNNNNVNSVNSHNHADNASTTSANNSNNNNSEQPVLFSQFFANVQPRTDQQSGKPAFTTYFPPTGNNAKQHATSLPWQSQEQDQEQIRSAAAVATAAAAVAAASSPSCSLVLSEPFTSTAPADQRGVPSISWMNSQPVHPLAHIDDTALVKDESNLFATEQFLSQPWAPPCDIVNECKPRCLSESELQYGSSNMTWNCNDFRRAWSLDASAMCSPLPDQYSMDLYGLQGMPFDYQSPMQQQQQPLQQQKRQEQQQFSPPLISSCSASTVSANSVTGSPISLDGYYDQSSFNYGLDQQQTSCSSTDALIASALA